MDANEKKQNGWPSCSRCLLWKAISCECGAENDKGEVPCEIMSKKQFDYLCKQAEEE